MTVFCVGSIHFRSIVSCDDTLRLSHCKTTLFVINCYQCVKNFQLYIEILPILHVVKLYKISSLIVISAAAAAASRCGLHQVTNDEVDGQGDRDDHVTEWWRHHRSVAQIRIAGTDVGRGSFIRIRSTTSKVVQRPSGTITWCSRLLWNNNKNKKNLVVISFCEQKIRMRGTRLSLPSVAATRPFAFKISWTLSPVDLFILPIWSVFNQSINQSIRKIFNVSRITNVIARSTET